MPGVDQHLRKAKTIENVRHVIEAMVQDIVARVQPEKLILFGSYATGTYNDNSDVDLLIVKETSLPVPKRVLEIRKILSKYDIPKDILYKTPQEFGRFKHIVNTLDYEIETKGVILYER